MPVLALPDFSKPFDVTTDENVVAVGGELAQGGHPLAFCSKMINPTESRYHVTDRELMGVYLGLRGLHGLWNSVSAVCKWKQKQNSVSVCFH